MKNLKFSLTLVLVVLLALTAPFATYATEATATTTDDAVVTSETVEGETLVMGDPTEGDATSEESTTTEETTLEEVKGNYFETNTNLVFNKAVDGNAFLLGDTVTIKGQVNGDVYVCAKDITLDAGSQIYGNLFLVAENFTQVGLVYNLFAFTTNYTCEYDGLTALDLKVFADNIKFSGYSERTAYLSANNIELTDDAYILGNLVYSSANEPVIAENALIYGEKIKDSNTVSFIPEVTTDNQIIEYVLAAVTLLGTVLAIMFLVNFFKPNALTTDVKFNFVKLLKALGVGLLTLVVLSVIIALLLISLVFSEAAIILLIGLVLALLISATVAILTLATILYNKFNNGKSKFFAVLYTIVLTLVYFGISFIPYAGTIITLIINITGFSLIVMWLFNVRKTNKVIKPAKAEAIVEETVETDTEVQEETTKSSNEVVEVTESEETTEVAEEVTEPEVAKEDAQEEVVETSTESEVSDKNAEKTKKNKKSDK